MRYLTSFPPDFAFSRGSGEFLFLPTKIQNIYYFDNQSVIDLRSIPRLPLTYHSHLQRQEVAVVYLLFSADCQECLPRIPGLFGYGMAGLCAFVAA